MHSFFFSFFFFLFKQGTNFVERLFSLGDDSLSGHFSMFSSTILQISGAADFFL